MNTLDQILETVATREIDDAAVRDAQRKLEEVISHRLAQQKPQPSRVPKTGWLAATAAAVVAVLTLLWLPLNPVPTFAAVQKHFSEFQTLRFVIDQSVAGEPTIQTRVQATRSGNVRTEVGDDVSVIVNPAEGRVLTLIRAERIAIVAPLERRVEQQDSLKWLKDIREFQGRATRLPEPRLIDGQSVFGWQLEVEGIDMVLWATAEGLPLEMTMTPAAQLRLEFHFEFDVPLAAESFSTEVPAGYSLGTPEG